MNASDVLDIAAIATGLIGAFLNALLFWVVSKNRNIDKKCTIVYQNLAVIDIFNCLVIPICYMTVKGHGYNIDLDHPRNSIMYVLFGGAINIPYLMLIFLSVTRVLMFKYPMVYINRINLMHFKIACVVCWVLVIGLGVGVWLCYLLSGDAKVNILIDLLKFESVATAILVIATIAAFGTILNLLQRKISTLNIDYSGSVPTVPEERMQLESMHNALRKDLSSARLTFSYFLVSVVVWSAFPFAFSVAFVLCGPYYNTTLTSCNYLDGKWFSDPKLSYAIMLLSLCGMSIVNSIILMRQKSFFDILKNVRIFRLSRCFAVNEEDDVQEPQPVQPVITRKLEVPNLSTSCGDIAETMKSTTVPLLK